MQEILPGFRHNDLHSGNILLNDLQICDMSIIVTDDSDKEYKLTVDRAPVSYIIDFGR